MEKFSTFSIMVLTSLTQHPTGKEWFDQNLFKFLKDTISKTNTCFQQHHDFLKETFQKIP
jgi:hypothetical protein